MKVEGLELKIDRIVLEGTNPGNHKQMEQTLQSELTRLFKEKGVSKPARSGGYVPRIETKPIEKDSSSSGESSDAAGLAQSIYNGLTQSVIF